MKIRAQNVASAILFTTWSLSASHALAVDVTVCGQEVPAYETGVLTADLDCSALDDGSGVILGKGTILDLQGHTVTGPGGGASSAVHCALGGFKCNENPCSTVCVSSTEPCTVTSSTGTGVIRGDVGISSERSLVASNLLIQPTNSGITLGERGRLEATNVVVENGSFNGIYGAEIYRCIGGFGARLRLANVSVTGFGGWGIFAVLGRVDGTDIVVSNNGMGGIVTSNAKITGLSATGNGAAGIDVCGGGVCAGKIKLDDAVVTGNSFKGAPVDLMSGAGSFFHIGSLKMPNVNDSTCDHSAKLSFYGQDPPYQTWGICTDD